MLSVVSDQPNLVRHTLRFPDVYIVPRSDGRILIGATIEEAGFDKRTVPETIQTDALMRRSKKFLLLGKTRILEAWAGLRPGTPDNLPILGRDANSRLFRRRRALSRRNTAAPRSPHDSWARWSAGRSLTMNLARFLGSRFD